MRHGAPWVALFKCRCCVPQHAAVWLAPCERRCGAPFATHCMSVVICGARYRLAILWPARLCMAGCSGRIHSIPGCSDCKWPMVMRPWARCGPPHTARAAWALRAMCHTPVCCTAVFMCGPLGPWAPHAHAGGWGGGVPGSLAAQAEAGAARCAPHGPLEMLASSSPISDTIFPVYLNTLLAKQAPPRTPGPMRLFRAYAMSTPC